MSTIEKVEDMQPSEQSFSMTSSFYGDKHATSHTAISPQRSLDSGGGGGERVNASDNLSRCDV